MSASVSNRKSSTHMTDGGWRTAIGGHRPEESLGRPRPAATMEGTYGGVAYARCSMDQTNQATSITRNADIRLARRVDQPPVRRNFAAVEALDGGDCKSLRAESAARCRFALSHRPTTSALCYIQLYRLRHGGAMVFCDCMGFVAEAVSLLLAAYCTCRVGYR